MTDAEIVMGPQYPEYDDPMHPHWREPTQLYTLPPFNTPNIHHNQHLLRGWGHPNKSTTTWEQFWRPTTHASRESETFAVFIDDAMKL